MIKSHKLLLASKSPRRKDLLNSMGIELIICPANIDETLNIDESPADYVFRIATQKADAIDNRDHCVLAADTIVVLDDNILGKPTDKNDAFKMWSSLSGRWHTVITAYTIISTSGKSLTKSISTNVKFKNLSHEEMEAYIDTGEWCDKAGGYAVQGISGFWVEKIDGSYTNVVGLPITEVAIDLIKLNPHWPVFPWSKQ